MGEIPITTHRRFVGLVLLGLSDYDYRGAEISAKMVDPAELNYTNLARKRDEWAIGCTWNKGLDSRSYATRYAVFPNPKEYQATCLYEVLENVAKKYSGGPYILADMTFMFDLYRRGDFLGKKYTYFFPGSLVRRQGYWGVPWQHYNIFDSDRWGRAALYSKWQPDYRIVLLKRERRQVRAEKIPAP